MEDVISFLEDTINKSALGDFKSYLCSKPFYGKWLICSDYCIGNKNKPNDVVSFTIMPYDTCPDEINGRFISLAPKEINKIKRISPDFISYLKEKRLFHLNFILGTRKGLTRRENMKDRQVVDRIFEDTNKMLEDWSKISPGNLSYYKVIQKKINKAKSELGKKSANYRLFRDVMLISLLSAYISYLLTKYSKARIVGWFSDRDKIIDSYDTLAAELFDIYHHGLCEKGSLNSSATEIVFGVPETSENGVVGYDEVNRSPDHIAGTLADFNFENNAPTKPKFVAMLEDCIADNPFLTIFRLKFAVGNYNCCRVVISKDS